MGLHQNESLLSFFLVCKVCLVFSSLHDACIKGDVETVKRLLHDPKLNINKFNLNGNTALGLAVQASSSEETHIITSLLVNHPNINLEKGIRDGASPFVLAVTNMNIHAADLLLSKQQLNVNIKCLNLPSMPYCTPLLIAIKNAETSDASKRKEFFKLIKKMLKHEKIDVKISCGGVVPFLEAIKLTNESIIKAFLKHKIWDINADQNGDGALHLALKLSQTKMIPHILSYPDLNLNMTDNDGNTIMHLASERLENDEIVDLLSDFLENRKMSLNIRNNQHELAYHVFLKALLKRPGNQLEMIMSSLVTRSDFCAHDAADFEGNTILHLLIRLLVSWRDERTLRYLDDFNVINSFKEAGYDFNSRNNEDQTILQLCMDGPRSETTLKILNFLLAVPGINPNLTDRNGLKVQVALKVICKQANLFPGIHYSHHEHVGRGRVDSR